MISMQNANLQNIATKPAKRMQRLHFCQVNDNVVAHLLSSHNLPSTKHTFRDKSCKCRHGHAMQSHSSSTSADGSKTALPMCW